MPLLYETTQKAANLTEREIGAIADRLKGRIAGEVRMDRYNRLMYSTDASMYQMMPVGVVLPRDADDVEAAILTAREFGVPVLPRGGGTALAGQTTNHAIVIDFSKYMRDVLEVSPEERWARVQPGQRTPMRYAAVNPEIRAIGTAAGASVRATRVSARMDSKPENAAAITSRLIRTCLGSSKIGMETVRRSPPRVAETTSASRSE